MRVFVFCFQRFNGNILQKKQPGSKPQQYCCVAIGSRDRSLSVWLTSLKRPLVVIHELFTHSVLDASWSPCGLRLAACSWDGSVVFVEFTQQELGQPLDSAKQVHRNSNFFSDNESEILLISQLCSSFRVLFMRTCTGNPWYRAVVR